MRGFSVNISMLFNEYDFLERFKAAKQCGFDAVEIQFPYEYPAQVIKQALKDNDLTLVLINVPADDLLQGGEGLAAVPGKKNHFKQAVNEAINYAKILKPEAINVLSGRVLDTPQQQQYRDTFIENLSFALDAFAEIGIKTVFEAINTDDMPGFLIHSSQQMLEIIQQVNHPDLFMQYDLYHILMMAEDPFSFISQHANKIGHIQFADVPGRGQPGTGKADFNAIFKAIEKSGYNGWVGAEYKPVGASIESFDWYEAYVRNL